MFLSRFWTLLLAIAVALMLAVVMLARDLVNREREENATASVYKEMDKRSLYALLSKQQLIKQHC